jgi:hypothetical protein
MVRFRGEGGATLERSVSYPVKRSPGPPREKVSQGRCASSPASPARLQLLTERLLEVTGSNRQRMPRWASAVNDLGLGNGLLEWDRGKDGRSLSENCVQSLRVDMQGLKNGRRHLGGAYGGFYRLWFKARIRQ